MPNTNRQQQTEHAHEYERRRDDCPMTTECVEKMLATQTDMSARLKYQGDQLDKLVATVTELRDFYIVQKALLPIIKKMCILGVFLGVLTVYYLGTGELPIKQLADLLLKLAVNPSYALSFL